MEEPTRIMAFDAGAKGQTRVAVGVAETDLIRSRSSGFDVLSVAGGTSVGEVGWPALPARLVTVALPAGSRPIQVTLVGAHWRTLPDVIRLAPVQPPRKASSSPGGNPTGGNPAAGNSGRARVATTVNGIPTTALARAEQAGARTPSFSAPPPLRQLAAAALAQDQITAPVQVVSQGHCAGVELVTVRVPVLRYSPVAGRADLLVEGDLDVAYIPGPPTPASPLTPLAAWYDAHLLRALPIDGVGDLPTDPSTVLSYRVKDNRPNTLGTVGPITDVPITWWLTEGEFPYVIITDDVFHEVAGPNGPTVPGPSGATAAGMSAAFARVARWKTLTGLRARVVTVSEILANRYGPHRVASTRDIPEAIRNFCKTAYHNWQTRWILIGGDLDIVPIRHVTANYPWYFIGDDTHTSPGDEQRYYVSGGETMRYRPGEDVTTDMVLLKTDDGTAIRYQVGASAGAPGWYFVADDWSTPSSTPTRNLIVAAPVAWFSVAFTRPQYVSMIPTDLYYGSIVNPSLYGLPGHHDWDLDGNGYYGFDAAGNPDGFDLNSDLSVGRVPVRTAAQANAWIDKLISYETFHDVSTEVELPGDFPQRLVAVGAVWGSNWSDDSTQRLRWGDMDGASADKDSTIVTLRNAGVHVDRVRRFLGDGYFAQNRNDLVEMTDAHIPMLRDAMNWGPAYVTVSGHGWWDGCSWLSSENSTAVNVEGMYNGMRGGVWFVDSCWTNEIDHHLFPPDASRDTEPCLGKHLISRSGGGAVAYLGCTRECEVGSSQEQVFWDGMLYPWLRRIGPMADRTRVIGRGAVGAYEVWLLTLLGDPEMKLRTRTPDTFNVSFPAVVYGQDQLTVEVFRQDAPVLDWELQVAVTADGADPQNPTAFTLTARDGNRFTFDTRSAADGQLNICVTAPDAIPLVCYATKVGTPISDAARHVSGVLTGGVVSAVTMAGAHLVAGTSDGLVAALDPTTLTTRWSYSLTGEVLGLVSAADGSVLAGARAAAGANLVLLDVTGSPARSWSTGHNVYALARDPARGMVYAGMDSVGLAAYRTSDGAQVFTGAGSTCIGLAVAPDGRVLATGGDSTGHRVYCYHSDGSLAWSYRVGDGSDGGWAMSLAVTADGTCWVGSRDNKLHRIDATGSGAVLSSVSLQAPAITLLGDGSAVAVGCGDGQVLRLDNNGSPLWSTNVGERVESLVIYGGYTYAGSWTKVTALTGTGDPAWSRVTNATVLGETATGNLLVGGHLFAGTRDGWVYRIMLSPGLIWYPGTAAAVASAQALAATHRIKLDVAALKHYLAGQPVLPVPGPPPPGPRPVAALG